MTLAAAFACSGTDDGAKGPPAEAGAGSSSARGGAGGSNATGGAGGSNAAGGTGGSNATGGTSAKGGATASGGRATGAGGISTGGGPGTGGAPAHIVADCDGLPPAEQAEPITPPGIDTELGVTSVVIDPIHAGTVYVGTDHRGLFKSTDCGANWTMINTGTGGDILDSGTIWSLYIDPVNPERLYAGSLYGSDPSLLRSSDSGVSWASVFPKGSEVAEHVEYNFFQELGMEQGDPRHLVASFHANCKAPYATMCMAESKDGGDTWRIFDGPTSGWGENARPFVLGPKTFLFATWADGVFYTGDGGENWEKLSGLPGANHQMYRRSDGTFFLGTYAGVFHSTDGHAWAKIEGSPVTDGLVGDGQRLFSGNGGDVGPFFTAPENTAEPWTNLSAPKLSRVVAFAMDRDHHVLYSAATASGIYRLVTQR